MCNEREEAPVVYKVVPGFPDRLVGTDGSYWKAVHLKKTPGKYMQTHLGLDRKTGQCVFNNLHEVVLATFEGPRPPGMECCHGDGNPHNNAIGNLRYDIHANNAVDMVVHGRCYLSYQRGSKVHSAKLDENKVREIRRLRKEGLTNKEIAVMYGVSETTISAVDRGDVWGHVEDEDDLRESEFWSETDDPGATDKLPPERRGEADARGT